MGPEIRHYPMKGESFAFWTEMLLFFHVAHCFIITAYVNIQLMPLTDQLRA